MNNYNLITTIALFIFVIVIPVYAVMEPERMAQAQAALRQEFVSDAAVIYVENCALCHGAAGEGIGSMPSLDNEGLRQADFDLLYKTIARGRYDTVMAGWHEAEGGSLNEYQVNELVALIRYADWSEVGMLAAERDLIPPTLPVPEMEPAMFEEIVALGADGAVWAEGMTLFANHCTVCHGIQGEGTELGVVLNSAEVRVRETAVLARTISEGVPATLMTGWANVLSPAEIDAVVAFLKNWDAITAAGMVLTSPAPIQIDANNSEEMLALGEKLYNTTCIACHGENGSGGTGPVLNSQQILTKNSDEQLTSTIINGGHRPNTSMPSFGDRLAAVEIEALVRFLRAWEPTAPWVENPRGTAQGGGPPWLRTAPDANHPAAPRGGGQGQGQGQGQRQGQGNGADTAVPTPPSSTQSSDIYQFTGEVVTVDGNGLTFKNGTNGTMIKAMLGPSWFWEKSGIALNQGDQISLAGFQSPEHLELTWLINLTSGESVQLRNAEGSPVWSGSAGEN